MVNKAFPQDFTAKTTPVDADLLLIADSADNNEAKKVTMTQLKSNIIVDSSSATDETWSADKLTTQFAAKANTSHTHAATDITSGTLTHERGGLEADVSAYNGLVKITGGATSAVTAPSGTVVGTTDSQTLTNKTIDPLSNTINGDVLDVDYTPTNYTRATSGTEATQTDQLAANLKGIDTKLGDLVTSSNPNQFINSFVTSSAYNTLYLMPTVGTTADAISNGWTETNAIMTANQGGGGIILFDTSASADASITTLLPGYGSQAYFRFADIGANAIYVKTRIKFGTSPGATEAMSWGLNTLTELEDHIGASIRFCLADNTGDKLYAVNANGTTNTNTNVTGSLTLTDWLNLAMVITSTQVLFYAGNTNALTLVATHTTNLPTATTQLSLGWGIVDNGSQPDMYITPTIISLPNS